MREVRIYCDWCNSDITMSTTATSKGDSIYMVDVRRRAIPADCATWDYQPPFEAQEFCSMHCLREWSSTK
jgi:hypothetical protein